MRRATTVASSRRGRASHCGAAVHVARQHLTLRRRMVSYAAVSNSVRIQCGQSTDAWRARAPARSRAG